MRGSLFQHLQHGLQHADHRAERAILPFVEATQAVEMPEQLIGAVDDVNDHAPRRIVSAAFSPIMYTALTMNSPGIRGKIDASTTRRPLQP